jgi:hypothetical protein
VRSFGFFFEKTTQSPDIQMRGGRDRVETVNQSGLE